MTDTEILQNLHAHPVVTRRTWTVDEDLALIAVKRSGVSDDDLVAKLVERGIYRQHGAVNARVITLRDAGIPGLYSRRAYRKRRPVAANDGWRTLYQPI
jgi:hypothetical protein